MPRFVTVIVLLFVFLVMPASAQITMTRDDIVPQLGELHAVSFNAVNPTGLEAIVNATGGNQTYDLTAFTYEDGDSSIVDVVMPSDAIPGADDPAFENADFVSFQDPDKAPNADLNNPVYMFYSEDGDGYFLHGSVGVADLDGDGSDDATISKNVPPLQIFAMGVFLHASDQRHPAHPRDDLAEMNRRAGASGNREKDSSTLRLIAPLSKASSLAEKRPRQTRKPHRRHVPVAGVGPEAARRQRGRGG